MNPYTHLLRSAGGFFLALTLVPTMVSGKTVDEKFDTLEIGTQTYTNVTVTTKARDYIFILHSTGMANIKVSELPQDLLIKFGYLAPPQPKTNNVSNWAKEKMASIESPQIKKLHETFLSQTGPAVDRFRSGGPTLLYATVGVALLLYLFSAYCCSMICRKVGYKPGILIWVPILNLIPLLRAAGMSPAWFFGFLLPVVNLITYIVWSFKIVEARNKQTWLALLMVLPLTSPFIIMYLAFSSSPVTKEKKERSPQIMTLETV